MLTTVLNKRETMAWRSYRRGQVRFKRFIYKITYLGEKTKFQKTCLWSEEGQGGMDTRDQ